MSTRETRANSISTETAPGLDEAVLAAVLTALLIRLGGKTILTPDEWRVAIEHKSSLWVQNDGQSVLVVLMATDGDPA